METSGRTLRDEAMARAEAGAEEWFLELAEGEVRRLARSGQPFTTDDLWQALGQYGGEPRALGPVLVRARRAGMIKPLGWQESAMPSCHARPKRVWVGV